MTESHQAGHGRPGLVRPQFTHCGLARLNRRLREIVSSRLLKGKSGLRSDININLLSVLGFNGVAQGHHFPYLTLYWLRSSLEMLYLMSRQAAL